MARGTHINPTTLAATPSAVTWQSLLEKIYGFERIGTPNRHLAHSVCYEQSQLPRMQRATDRIHASHDTSRRDDVKLSGGTIDPFHYVGCVVTMLDGPNAGLSSRIVGINPTNYNVQMVAFDGGVLPAANLNGNHYIVNGFPYSGMGFGFSQQHGQPVAIGGFGADAERPAGKLGRYAGHGIIPGGVNSDYTAADYQDPLIALAVPESDYRRDQRADSVAAPHRPDRT